MEKEYKELLAKHDAFIKLVDKMRTTQATYFRLRAKGDENSMAVLKESKSIEKEVDLKVKEWKDRGKPKQGTLYE